MSSSPPHVLPAGTAPEDVAGVVARMATAGGGVVEWWVEAATDEDDRLAADLGFTPDRELLQLRRPLPAPAPPDLAIRPFRPGEDDEAWLALNNRAFAWHPDQGGWDRDTLDHRLAEDWFDAGGFLLHEREGRLAGFCWTKVHPGQRPPLGEIYVIGVDPDHQGEGLGRALTLAGLDHLHRERGVDVGMLYVESDNTSARGLYGALGFTEHHRDRRYQRSVPTAPET